MLHQHQRESFIVCPKCSHEIALTESLAAPLLEAERQRNREQSEAKEAGYRQRAEEIRLKEEAVDRARTAMDDEVARRLREGSSRIRAEEQKKALEAAAAELQVSRTHLAEMQETLKRADAKVAEARQAQAQALKKERELDEQKREFDLLVEKRVSATQADIHLKARRQVEDELKARVSQKDAQIESMGKTIEELKRKAAQGSQQIQGEAMEVELEALLRTNFPLDQVEAVGKGELGGDILQRVNGQFGPPAGTILWEFKSTRNWNDAWLTKLREDQRSAKADVALIVSHALPKDVETFGLIDGVWIAHPRCAIPVAVALRHSLVELSSLRGAKVGQQTKMEQIYQYLIGPRFRQRIEGIVEKFEDLKLDLDKERKFMNRVWAKREGQIQGVIEVTVGMYGDLQGIAGVALPEIPSLDVPLLDATQTQTQED
jgi:hypothetical protein